VNISAIAPARLFGATMSAATTEPTPKNAPYTAPRRSGPIISTE